MFIKTFIRDIVSIFCKHTDSEKCSSYYTIDEIKDGIIVTVRTRYRCNKCGATYYNTSCKTFPVNDSECAEYVKELRNSGCNELFEYLNKRSNFKDNLNNIYKAEL